MRIICMLAYWAVRAAVYPVYWGFAASAWLTRLAVGDGNGQDILMAGISGMFRGAGDLGIPIPGNMQMMIGHMMAVRQAAKAGQPPPPPMLPIFAVGPSPVVGVQPGEIPPGMAFDVVPPAEYSHEEAQAALKRATALESALAYMVGAKITALRVDEDIDERSTGVLILTEEGGVALSSRTLLFSPIPKGVILA